MATLAPHSGGPAAGRVRALRRLLKTLVADVYVIDRAGAVDGVVALRYGRSLHHGGLVATVDAMIAFHPRSEQRQQDLSLLARCALTRARRRGCVEIDASLEAEDARRALEQEGLVASTPLLARTLRREQDG